MSQIKLFFYSWILHYIYLINIYFIFLYSVAGDLSVENFFKEVTTSSTMSTSLSSSLQDNISGGSNASGNVTCGGPVPVIDNILVKFEQMQLCRALMTLAGSLEVQVILILLCFNICLYYNV